MPKILFVNKSVCSLLLLLFFELFVTVKPGCASTWVRRNPSRNPGEYFQSIACSADGSTLVVCSSSSNNTANSIGQIFVSTNFGKTWRTTSAPTNWWTSVACSADGTKMVASAIDPGHDQADSIGGIYTSWDSGATWQKRTSPPIQATVSFFAPNALASSANGVNLVVAASTNIYYSQNSGVTWQSATTQNVITNGFTSVASSSVGDKVVAVGGDGRLTYLSSDFGATWTPPSTPPSFLNGGAYVASSADGHKLVQTGIVQNGIGAIYTIYTSVDFGMTWQQQAGAPSAANPPFPIASSADGSSLVAGAKWLFTSLDSGVTWVSNSAPGDFWLSVASSADGTRLAAVPNVSGTGIFTVQTDLGHVFCLCNTNGIPGATIQFGTNLITAGDDGSYSLTNVAPGTYDVTVSATNFLSLTTNITIKAKQQVPDFYLTNTTFIITPVLDASITDRSDSDTISNSILAATQEYSQYIADPICVKILFANINKGLGQSVTLTSNLPYSTYLADLKASTNLSANDIAALATLNPPPDTGLLGNTMVSLTAANLEAIGEHAMADGLTKRYAGFNSEIQFNFSIMNTSRPDQDPTLYDLQSTALHEIDEVLGIGGNASTLSLTNAYSGQTGPTDGVGPLDLYRYATPGFRSFSLSPNVKAYFSINGGTNVLVYFNQLGWTSSGGSPDFGDWGDGVVPADGKGNTNSMVQDAVGTPGASEDLGANELIALDVIGYTLITKSTILNFVYLGGPTFKFSFATAPGQTYQVQSTASLNPPISWTNLGPPFLAADITSAFTDTNAMGTQLYYRVNALPSTNHAPAVIIHQQSAIAPADSSVGPIIRRHVIVPRDR